MFYYFKAIMCFSFSYRYLVEEYRVGKALIHVIFQNSAMGCLNFVYLIWELPTYKHAIINLPIALEEYAKIERSSARICLENVIIYLFFWALFLNYIFLKSVEHQNKKDCLLNPIWAYNWNQCNFELCQEVKQTQEEREKMNRILVKFDVVGRKWVEFRIEDKGKCRRLGFLNYFCSVIPALLFLSG